jgi:hypothetical protein
MSYQYFTAFDIKYAWWGIHLARSIYVNSPDSNFNIFLLLNADQTDSIESKKVIDLILKANPSTKIEVIALDHFMPSEALKRYCAGFRTTVFGPSRDKYFEKDDTLVWIDADSIVRNPLKELEVFCEENSFDVAARAKNAKYKFASGLIIQKGTSAARDFGNKWFSKWGHRFSKSEWTADQNAFNDTSQWFFSRGIGNVIAAPKSFCDVWLSESGLIWQAKHQTKMKKIYVDEMKTYRPESSSKYWEEMKAKMITVAIDTTTFSYKGVNFEFMGLDGEEIFEEIKRTGCFYNVEYLEAIAKLDNKDSHVIVGAGLQNENVYLTAFNNCLMSFNFEPQLKMIDIGLRNSQNNPGASRGAFTLGDPREDIVNHNAKKDLIAMFLNWKTSDGKEVSSICKSIGEPQRIIDGNYRYGSMPNDLDYGTKAFLRSDKYKTMRKVTYTPDTVERMDFLKEVIKDVPDTNTSLSAPLDEIIAAVHREVVNSANISERDGILTPWSRGQCRENYDFTKFVGLLVIDVFNYSLDILKTAPELLKFFYPHVAITVYDSIDQNEKVDKIETMLGPQYEKIYDKPPALDPGARCLVYKSLRRKQ